MKTLVLTILLTLLCISSYPQVTKVTETPEAYIITVQSAKGSLDSGDVFESNPFDATSIIACVIDSTAKAFIRAQVIYNGSGTDSTGTVLVQGVGADGSYNTFDTLGTNGATPFATTLFNPKIGLVYYKEWRIKTTVPDITVSSYDATFYAEIIVPKRSK